MIKTIFFSIVDTIMLMMVATIFSVIFSFIMPISTSTIFFVMFPMIIVVKFYSLNSKIKPMEKELNFLRKENDNKNEIIHRFLKLQGCD